MEWGGGRKYGDVRLREEVEQSKYAFNQQTGISAERFSEFHRHQFEENFRFAEELLKGGLIIGGQYGRGILSARDPKTGEWSSPAFLSITGGSLGAQIGGQAVDLVLIVQNRRGLEQLVRNQFKIGADASVAAGPVGRDASASTDIQMRAQILSYSRTRGLFAGVSINGTTIRQDRDANDRFYGLGFRTGQIVFEGKAGSPDPVSAWRAVLDKHTR